MQDPLQDDADPSINPNDDGERDERPFAPFPRRQQDPQIVVTARVKEGSKGELLVFSIPLGLFELVCIANIPAEGENEAPVYVKHKVRRPRKDSQVNGDDEG